MKRREDAKHERRNGVQAQPFAIHVAFRIADFHCVWLPKPPAADRARKIYRVVPASFSFDRRGNRLGDVSLLALKGRHIRHIRGRTSDLGKSCSHLLSLSAAFPEILEGSPDL